MEIWEEFDVGGRHFAVVNYPEVSFGYNGEEFLTDSYWALEPANRNFDRSLKFAAWSCPDKLKQAVINHLNTGE